MFDITKAYIREREKDDQRTASVKVLQKVQAEEDFINREDTVDRKRIWRMRQLEAKEMELVESLQRKKQHSEANQKIMQENERIAKELRDKKDVEMAEQAVRKKIRESSEEIRKLEEKLRAAYVAKSQRAQITERRALDYDHMVQENNYWKSVEFERRRAEEVDATSAQDSAIKVKIYQEELEQQIEEKNKMKEQKEIEKINDRKRIDVELEQQRKEDEKTHEKEQLYKDQLKAIISQDFVLRAKERETRQKELEAEEKRIILDEQRILSRYSDIQEAKETRQAKLEEVQTQLGELVHQKEKERKELDEIRMELSLEEEETRAFEHERIEDERRRKAKSDLQADKIKQFEEHNERKLAQQAEEEAIKQIMLAKFAEDDKLEQLSNQRRRQKMIEHRRAADEFIEQRRKHYLELMVKEEEKLIREREALRAHDTIVEEERLRILETHAPHLVGYLAKGVIKTEGDLNHLGDEVKAHYKHIPTTFEYLP